MNTNGQILNDVHSKLDYIRRLKAEIDKRELAIAALNGRTQRSIELCLGGGRINLGVNDHARGTNSVRKPFDTAMVFIRRGLNEEIEQFQSTIEQLKSELNEMKVGDLVK